VAYICCLVLAWTALPNKQMDSWIYRDVYNVRIQILQPLRSMDVFIFYAYNCKAISKPESDWAKLQSGWVHYKHFIHFHLPFSSSPTLLLLGSITAQVVVKKCQVQMHIWNAIWGRFEREPSIVRCINQLRTHMRADWGTTTRTSAKYFVLYEIISQW
jgi:hypothetical protein